MDLVKSLGKESGKGTAEHHVAVPSAQAYAHAHQVLLGYEALHKALGEGILVGDGKGGVLGVPIQSHQVVFPSLTKASPEWHHR